MYYDYIMSGNDGRIFSVNAWCRGNPKFDAEQKFLVNVGCALIVAVFVVPAIIVHLNSRGGGVNNYTKLLDYLEVNPEIVDKLFNDEYIKDNAIEQLALAINNGRLRLTCNETDETDDNENIDIMIKFINSNNLNNEILKEHVNKIINGNNELLKIIKSIEYSSTGGKKSQRKKRKGKRSKKRGGKKTRRK